MNTITQGAGMIDSNVAMWIFWVVVSALMFFVIRACIRHSTLASRKAEPGPTSPRAPHE